MNQISKGEIEKRILIILKDSKQKIAIKKIRIKIEIEINFIFDWRVKLKKKSI